MKSFAICLILVASSVLAAEPDPAPAVQAAPAKVPKQALRLGLVPRPVKRTSLQSKGGFRSGGAKDLLGVTRPLNQGPSEATHEGMLRQQAEQQRLEGTLPNPYGGNSQVPPQVSPVH